MIVGLYLLFTTRFQFFWNFFLITRARINLLRKIFFFFCDCFTISQHGHASLFRENPPLRRFHVIRFSFFFAAKTELSFPLRCFYCNACRRHRMGISRGSFPFCFFVVDPVNQRCRHPGACGRQSRQFVTSLRGASSFIAFLPLFDFNPVVDTIRLYLSGFSALLMGGR